LGRGVTLQSSTLGSSAQGPTPHPFVYHFDSKGTPFEYLQLKEGTPSHTFTTGMYFEYIVKKGRLLVIFMWGLISEMIQPWDVFGHSILFAGPLKYM